MKQEVKTPNILRCWCGAESEAFQSMENQFMYQVMCKQNHTLSKECGSVHRAVCLWNNRVVQHNQEFKEKINGAGR